VRDDAEIANFLKWVVSHKMWSKKTARGVAVEYCKITKNAKEMSR